MIKVTDHPKLEGVKNISQETAVIQSDQEALVNASKQHNKILRLKRMVAYLEENSLQHTGCIKGENLGNRTAGGAPRLAMGCKLGRSLDFDIIARSVGVPWNCRRKATFGWAQRNSEF